MNFTRLLVLLALLLLAHAGVAQAPLSSGYYVVVAAYKNTREAYASRYADALKLKGHDAHYGLSKSGKLYLVYVHYDDDRSQSLTEMKGERKKGEFPDAWVSVVKDVQAQPYVAKAETDKPVGSTTVASAPGAPTTTQPAPVNTQPVVPVTPEKAPEPVPSPVQETPAVTTPENTVVEIPKDKFQGTLAYLNLNYSTKNEQVYGEVELIDTDRARLIEKVKANRVVVLPDPKSKTGQLTLVTDVFGYRKVQHEIRYPLSLADTTQDFISAGDSALVITFDLIRYHRGDVQTLYHVYFYNDAVIMLPESKYELNSLVQMMQENPNYRIRLHGHSNGNHSGKILALGPDKNFFDMEGTVQGQGSAKDLSGQRAGVIKEYLVTNGIAADRVELKAWGGKKPIYDKHSVNAKKNVRVEVEILKD
jgi:outer membrane protein OmpA-like peptidoglycan-associated protein